MIEERPGRFRPGARPWAVLVLAGLMLAAAAPAHAVEDPWAPGTGWISVRAGYAKLASPDAPNGAAGYGFGYTRMLQPVWKFTHMSVSGYVHHEMLGHVAQAAIIDVPISLEISRHFLWNGGFRPYFGAGYGANFVKGYRYPDSFGSVRGGTYLVGGGNVQVSPNGVFGFDGRAGIISDFDKTYVWSLKLNYAWVY